MAPVVAVAEVDLVVTIMRAEVHAVMGVSMVVVEAEQQLKQARLQ